MKITDATRKKLKKLNKRIEIFGHLDCFLPQPNDCEGSTKEIAQCFVCASYLPNPTTDELIEAIDEKCDVKWGIEREKKNGKWLVWFEREKTEAYFTEDDPDDCLASALIWLYEQEE
ncbi:hypothetical protein [Candidatus Oleimmundimicrobium sp.]|uniref:hypothetical protein n=1 Tax=Candidatus Oleimmundimicrobium sp. TaxID=3060597 RepID=UPI002717F0B9|nr:hypothetical protein [Candidatus Oleimmundimicrobium sp.]MDO8885749.1 hypothetical protein [Candidatus Oleimmundimicrobium sp.]